LGVENFVREADNMAQKYGERFKPPMSFREKADAGGTFYKTA
jgi:3-hydroxyacyl-CoA dehydrogenase/enoyl-CoA hydratase/3-hydroxybutyryl-CoA epimerase